MSNSVPKPPSQLAAVRMAKGLPPKTMAEELAERFEARLVANGGKWVPLTAEDMRAPPVPNFNEAVRQHRALQEKKK